MDADDASGLIRVAEWALNRFTERQLAVATGVVVLIYFRGEVKELARVMFARRSLKRRMEDVEAAVARAEAKVAATNERIDGLSRRADEQTAILHGQDGKMDLVIRLLRAEQGSG